MKDTKVTGLKLVDKGESALCTSIVVDGNHRFVLSDFSVVHDATNPPEINAGSKTQELAPGHFDSVRRGPWARR